MDFPGFCAMDDLPRAHLDETDFNVFIYEKFHDNKYIYI